VLVAQQPAPAPRAVELLLGKARSLEARGRIDLAAQTWQQLLMIVPDQQDAIAGLARAAKLQGKQSEAEAYLNRLRKANASNPAIKQIEAMDKSEKRNQDLEAAAKLAGSGQGEKAVAAYRKAFGGGTLLQPAI
jgi:DNA-binding SARP family transcriptional activator